MMGNTVTSSSPWKPSTQPPLWHRRELMHVYGVFGSIKPLPSTWKIRDKQCLKPLATITPEFPHPTKHTSPNSQSKEMFQMTAWSHACEGNSEIRQQLVSEEKWQRGKSKTKKKRRRVPVGVKCVIWVRSAAGSININWPVVVNGLEMKSWWYQLYTQSVWHTETRRCVWNHSWSSGIRCTNQKGCSDRQIPSISVYVMPTA